MFKFLGIFMEWCCFIYVEIIFLQFQPIVLGWTISKKGQTTAEDNNNNIHPSWPLKLGPPSKSAQLFVSLMSCTGQPIGLPHNFGVKFMTNTLCAIK